MNDRRWRPPRAAPPVATAYHDGRYGRMRSRATGRPWPGVRAVVVVQGMAVADYLLPGLATIGSWTRAYLLELPGLGGSGDPPHELSVPTYGDAVAEWLAAHRLGNAVLVGHSSGTQVAAAAAERHPDLAGVVLASPTIDPAARRLPSLLIRWWRNGRREPPGLTDSHRPEWRRAGARRLIHLVQTHRHHAIEAPLARLHVPVVIIRARDDALSGATWCRSLARLVPCGEYVEVPGAHSFPWLDPYAWSPPIRRLATLHANRGEP